MVKALVRMVGIGRGTDLVDPDGHICITADRADSFPTVSGLGWSVVTTEDPEKVAAKLGWTVVDSVEHVATGMEPAVKVDAEFSAAVDRLLHCASCHADHDSELQRAVVRMVQARDAWLAGG